MGFLYKAISPLLILSILFGTLPIVTKKIHGIQKLSISRWAIIITISYIIAYTTCTVNFLVEKDVRTNKPGYKRVISNIQILSQTLGQFVAAYIILFFNPIQSPSLKKCLTKLQKVDFNFENLGQKVNYRGLYIYQVVFITTGLTVIGMLLKKSEINTVQNLILKLPWIWIFLSESQFAVFVWLVYRRFCYVNNYIRKMNLSDVPTTKRYSSSTITDLYKLSIKSHEYCPSHLLFKTEVLMDIHYCLNDVAWMLNKCYDVQLLVCITTQFIGVVFSTFYAYYYTLIEIKQTSAVEFYIWTLFDACQILHFTIVCHLTSNEAKTTGSEISKALNNNSQQDFQEKLIIFSNQVLHKPNYFTVLSLFKIDATLLFMIAGSTSTYLLIMLQFQEGNNESCLPNHTGNS